MAAWRAAHRWRGGQAARTPLPAAPTGRKKRAAAGFERKGQEKPAGA